ncbi:methyl-accepting chemotaxis protein [Vibrio cidicii]|uniref:methyl-accepting chemotaxis protein n=1 Tax=Vibrio cidicii TaxID=1763883 RepID=UPI003704BEE6
MNIKQSVTLLLLLMGVSFSAFSGTTFYVVAKINNNSVANCLGVKVFDKLLNPPSAYPVCVPGYSNYRWGNLYSYKIVVGDSRYGTPINLTDIYYGTGSCQEGTEFNEETRQCEEPPPEETCADLKEKDAPSPGNRVPDDGKPLTATRLYCDLGKMCEAAHYWYASGDGMHVANSYTGLDCIGEESDYANGPWYGDLPDPEPEPQPDPTHTPDDPTTDIPDPSPLPDDSTSTLPPTPEPVDPTPDVPTPEPDPNGNGDVVQSVTNLNRDLNKSINDMNIDINKSNASIQHELTMLNENTRSNTQAIKDMHQASIDIAENNKALIQQANADITTAVNKTTNAVNGLGAELESIDGSLTGIGETLDGIGSALDGMANTDTSGAGTGGTCIASDNCTGFYTSSYPDGLGGVFTDHFSEVGTKVTDSLTGMFELDLSGASRPKFGIPVPFYGWFYFDDYINLDWIFAFVRVCMMVTTAFTCRKLLFGG